MDENTLKQLIHCPNGYLDRLLAGIKLLQENGFKIQFDTILTNLNSSEEDLIALYDYIKTINGLVYWEIRKEILRNKHISKRKFQKGCI